jgi:(heptosyl)LPS beta-1,4-glucosyltransferase
MLIRVNMKQKISVLIITFNEEQNIADCLESVKWADEIIVVDSFSTDHTIEIVKNYTDKIYQRKWEGYAKQKIFSINEATNEWILNLDADERISAELREAIEKILIENPEVNGYQVSVRNYYLGKWIKHANWYPDYHLKLFRRSKARIEDLPVHEAFEVDGRVEKLNGDLIHYSYPNLEYGYNKINKYSSLEASQRANKKVTGLDLFLHPLGAFLTDFISRKGYKDGVHGFLVAMMNMITNFLTYAKVWEIQNVKPDDQKKVIS